MFFNRVTATLMRRFRKNIDILQALPLTERIMSWLTDYQHYYKRMKRKARGEVYSLKNDKVSISVVFISYDHRNVEGYMLRY